MQNINRVANATKNVANKDSGLAARNVTCQHPNGSEMFATGLFALHASRLCIVHSPFDYRMEYPPRNLVIHTINWLTHSHMYSKLC